MYSSNLLKCNSVRTDLYYQLPYLEKAETAPDQVTSAATEQISDGGRQTNTVLLTEQASQKLLTEAKKQADEIIRQAEIKAQKLYDKSHQEAQRKGYIEGYEEGLKRGTLEAEQSMASSMEEVSRISLNMEEERKMMLDGQKELIIELAGQMAQKVISDDFMTEKGAFLHLFKRMVNDIPPADKLTVTVSGKDYSLKSFDAERLRGLAVNFEHVEIRCDNTAEPGTFKLETTVMMMDASVKSQLAIMKEELSSVV